MIVVDSCGWIEYFTRDANAVFFTEAIQDTPKLLVPGLVVYEVQKRLVQLFGPADAAKALPYMKLGRFVSPDWDTCVQAASAARQYQLHMADAIIWQTAQTHGATLYTQDAALQGLPGVSFRAKPPINV